MLCQDGVGAQSVWRHWSLFFKPYTYSLYQGLFMPPYIDSHTSREYKVKSVLSGHSKNDQKLDFQTDNRLMQLKSIAECFFNAFDLH